MFTTDDFENIHWHDNAIHGLQIIEGPDGYGGELVFDIDYIAEWLRPNEKEFNFNIVPSELVFHDVSDLSISIDYASATAATQPMIIHEIEREIVKYLNGAVSYNWLIDINWPSNGSIKFNANGFTQTPKMEPVVSGAQYLSDSERHNASNQAIKADEK